MDCQKNNSGCRNYASSNQENVGGPRFGFGIVANSSCLNLVRPVGRDFVVQRLGLGTKNERCTQQGCANPRTRTSSSGTHPKEQQETALLLTSLQEQPESFAQHPALRDVVLFGVGAQRLTLSWAKVAEYRLDLVLLALPRRATLPF